MTIRDIVATIIAESFPQLVYGYPRIYVVATVNADETLDLVPPPGASGLRPLKSVEQWTLGGGLVKPTVGARVAVAFAEADPALPVIVGFAPGTPTELHLCGKVRGVAGLGDAAGPFLITTASGKVKMGVG